MKKILLGLLILFSYCSVFSQTDNPHLMDSLKFDQLSEEAKQIWKEWRSYKMKIKKEIKIGKDSTEKYTTDKKSNQLVLIRIWRRPEKRRVENMYFYYVNSKLFRILYIASKQNDFGIWKDIESAVYIFLKDKLVERSEINIEPKNEDSLLRISEKYYDKGLAYLAQ